MKKIDFANQVKILEILHVVAKENPYYNKNGKKFLFPSSDQQIEQATTKHSFFF